MKKRIKSILFDFDGVLADTMNDNFIAWKRAFSDFGVNIQKDEYFILEGRKLIEIAKIIGTKYKINLENYSKIVELKNKYYLNLYEFRFYPGVEVFIDLIKKKDILISIVSASPREKLEKTVPKIFLEKFDVVISGDDVERGKPDPEPYLNACKKLGLVPEECIVVENAPLGIESSKRAGMYCVAICSTLDKFFLNKADIIINNFEELERLVNGINFQKVFNFSQFTLSNKESKRCFIINLFFNNPYKKSL
jgi:beta-phosphoglucomutase